MTYRINIDDSSDKAKAFIAYLKTLDFVSFEEQDIQLSDEQWNILEQRKKEHQAGKLSFRPWEEVKKELRGKWW